MWIRKVTAEFIGTFGLVFAGTGAIIINDVSGGVVSHVGISLTFGLIVMTMIYALDDVSGAHINPAVTLGFWIARRLPYTLSQCAGAIAASLTLRLLFFGHTTLGATLPSGPVAQSFVLEVILTFFLMFVILSVSIQVPKKKALWLVRLSGQSSVWRRSLQARLPGLP